jgi:hypothetical protein
MMLIVFVSSDFEVLLNDNDDDEDALNFEIFEVSICLYL